MNSTIKALQELSDAAREFHDVAVTEINRTMNEIVKQCAKDMKWSQADLADKREFGAWDEG